MTPYIASPAPDPAGPPEGGGRPMERDAFALLDQMPGAVLLLDPEGRIQHLNSIAELRLDLVRSEALGRDLFRDVLPQLEAEGCGEQFRGGMRAGRVALGCEAAFPQPAGPGRLSLGIRSIRGPEGRLEAVVLLEDRSALAAEEARRRRAERLAAVGELATGVAHEINNPLASIKGFAQLLAREAQTESQQQALDIISRETSRVARIIDNLLDFAGHQRVRGRESLDLSALVDHLLDLRQYALETSGIEIVRDLDLELSAVFAERSSMQRVVLSLLSHAERSLDARERDRRLTVRTRESTDGVVLYVVDNGAGIPRERLPTLLSTPADEEEAGGGIDLGVAYSTVRELGGHLAADSVEGHGTAFILRLPRAAEETAAVPDADMPRPTLRSMPERSLRVLVADDEATLRLAVALFLGRHGHEVVQAADAYEALRLVQEQRFDAVLADARMPGDGLALIEKLEAMPELRGRTVLMSGDHSHATTSEAVRSGRPQLSKPFDMTEVIRLVESIGR